MAKLSHEKRRQLPDSLELSLRRHRANEFQSFATRLLKKVHGENFEPTYAHGSNGDASSDGVLFDPLTVFACYGPVNGGAYVASTLKAAVDKIYSDYEGALKKWPDLKVWVFTHNFVDAIPGDMLVAITDLKGRKQVTVDMMGKDKFESLLLDMEEEDVERLVGRIFTRDDFMRLQPEWVMAAVDAIASEFTLGYLEEPNAPVPQKKLEDNRIPGCYARAIKQGMNGRLTVESCVARNADPTLETRLSVSFRSRYRELKAQGLAPGVIAEKLFDFALAGNHEREERRTAAWAVIAYLFEKCTIFEDKPWEDAA